MASFGVSWLSATYAEIYQVRRDGFRRTIEHAIRVVGAFRVEKSFAALPPVEGTIKGGGNEYV